MVKRRKDEAERGGWLRGVVWLKRVEYLSRVGLK